MESQEFVQLRRELNKTQLQMSQLLGTSIKAIHSYEQGWRKVPAYVERQVLFLIAQKGERKGQKPCWVIKKCPPEQKGRCPAWEFRAGRFCWFINGTICCGGEIKENWDLKMKMCRKCEVMSSLVEH